MTMELKKQKLHEYIDNASDEETNLLYIEIIEDVPTDEWNTDFLAEINQRSQDYLTGKEQTVSAEAAMEYALHPEKRK